MQIVYYRYGVFIVMRINFILPPINMSGGIRVVSIYAKQLSKRGHDVVVISPPSKSISLKEKVIGFLTGKGWLRAELSTKSHLDGLGLDHRVLDQNRPVIDADVPDADVTIATFWYTVEWVEKLHKNKGAKIYFIQHHEVHHYLPLDRVYNTYRLPFHKIVIAEWLRKVMDHTYGDTCVDLVPNAVDHSLFFAPVRTKQRRPTVGFLYSGHGFKGVPVTLKAIEILRERIPDLRAICFGTHRPDGNKALAPWIEYHYSPPQDQLRDYYATFDVWLTASRSEGFNLPAMEAMACRTPVVSTKTGWPEEAIVDGQNGYLVDIGDAEGLADRANQILALDERDWSAMSENAFNTVANCTWDQSTDLFEQALQHACSRARNGEIGGGCGGNA